MVIELYEHQEEVIPKIKNGSLLCGGTGSGKSRTALTFYFTKVAGGQIKDKFKKPVDPLPLYIITTARKRDTKEWDEECQTFLISKNIKESICNIKLTIDSWNNIKKYVDVKNAFFIFDEQRVVGYGTWAKSFIKISKNNRWILLSATPGDSWMDYIPVFIANGFYKNKTDFVKKHVVYNRFTKFPKVDKYINVGELIRHRNEILVYMRYASKAVKHQQVVQTMYPLREYETVSKYRWNPYDNEPIKNVSSACYLLRKVVNSDPSRVDAVNKIHVEYPKMIVFYNFDYELELLRKSLDETNIKEWNGHVHDPLPTGQRWIYLVQYTAGAEGWNCTSTNCIVFYSDSYSYKTMVQAMGRINRLNTPYSDLYYFRLRSRSPIEKTLGFVLKTKKDFNEKSFMGETWSPGENAPKWMKT